MITRDARFAAEADRVVRLSADSILYPGGRWYCPPAESERKDSERDWARPDEPARGFRVGMGPPRPRASVAPGIRSIRTGGDGAADRAAGEKLERRGTQLDRVVMVQIADRHGLAVELGGVWPWVSRMNRFPWRTISACSFSTPEIAPRGISIPSAEPMRLAW